MASYSTIAVATAVFFSAAKGATRALTVPLSSTPSSTIGKVVDPWKQQAILTSTLPFDGAVNVKRRLVVSNAVIARSAVVLLVTAAAGSYWIAARIPCDAINRHPRLQTEMLQNHL